MAFVGSKGSLAALVACALAAGCQVYDPSLVERDAGPAPECDPSRTPPERPGSEFDGDDGEEYIYGLGDVFLDQGGDWVDVGLNLDDRCTYSPSYDTECTPPMRARPPTDGNEGIDNVFGDSLFPLVDVAIRAQSGTDLQNTARSAQLEGKLPVVRIRGWNGEANDARVQIAITNAIFMVRAEADDSIPEFEVETFIPVDPTSREQLPFPAWDGTDYGFFRDETFLDGDRDLPLLGDDNAYVVDDTVVARLPDRFEILFPAQTLGVLVRLTDATAIGHFSEDRTRLENVVIGGRWRLLDIFATAENVGVCRDSDSYDILVGQLNATADLRAMPGSGGPDVSCDAISIGVQFQGNRMRWGGLTAGPPLRNICTEPDAGVPDGGLDAGTPDAGPSGDGG